MKSFWDINSNDNTLFVTAQCNNRCVMCCQPPTSHNDSLYQQNINLIHSAPKGIKVVGISGGEPTLLGDKLFDLIRDICMTLPNASIHILSNGRAFSNLDFAKEFKDATTVPVTIGIPIHSDYYRDHDKITGVDGSFEETVYGLYNLYSVGVDIELRVLVNALNFTRLPQIATFIYKNLPFARYVAFMGMEYTGWALKNHATLFISPLSYKDELFQAVDILHGGGLDVAIYNIPLCLLDERIRSYSCKSISDWKTEYSDKCNNCSCKESCCGLFATSKIKYSDIKALEI